MLQRLHHQVYSGLLQQQDRVGQVRLTAFAAPSSDSWLKAIPSWNQDTLLSNAAFRDSLSMRFWVRVFDDSPVCSFCQSHLDAYGHHCMCCMGQGHKQVMHTSFRNVVYRLAARAGALPCLEPTNLLPEMPQTRRDLQMCWLFHCHTFNSPHGDGSPKWPWNAPSHLPFKIRLYGKVPLLRGWQRIGIRTLNGNTRICNNVVPVRIWGLNHWCWKAQAAGQRKRLRFCNP